MLEIKISLDVKCQELLEAVRILTGACKNETAATNEAPRVGEPPKAAAVPVSTPPAYTVAQIGKAGAELLSQTNGAAMPQLTALLQKYGVSSADKLQPDQLGAFATELRGLGAKL